jgi:hypothetical protein
MNQCKWCEKSGLFYSINEDGLCNSCRLIIIGGTQSKVRVINDSRDLIEKSKNIETIISRTRIVLGHLKDLIIYEEKGIKILTHPIDKLLKNVAGISNERLMELITIKFQTAKEKPKASSIDKFISEAIIIRNSLFPDDEDYIVLLTGIEKMIDESKELLKKSISKL